MRARSAGVPDLAGRVLRGDLEDHERHAHQRGGREQRRQPGQHDRQQHGDDDAARARAASAGARRCGRPCGPNGIARSIGSTAKSASSTPTVAGDAPSASASSETVTREPVSTTWFATPSPTSSGSERGARGRHGARHGASRSRASSPRAVAGAIGDAIVQAARAALPELERVGHDAVAAPVRRPRHVVAGARARRRRSAARATRGRRSRSLCGDAHAPMRESVRPRREVGVRLGGVDALDDALDAHLALELHPVEQQRRRRAVGELASLAALVVGEEHEAARVDALQQHDAGRRAGRRRRRWRASSRWARAARAATASSNQRANCATGSRMDRVLVERRALVLGAELGRGLGRRGGSIASVQRILRRAKRTSRARAERTRLRNKPARRGRIFPMRTLPPPLKCGIVAADGVECP